MTLKITETEDALRLIQSGITESVHAYERSFQAAKEALETLQKTAGKIDPDFKEFIVATRKTLSGYENKLAKASGNVLSDKLKEYAGQIFDTQFGELKVSKIRTGQDSYFVILKGADGAELSISHRANGAFDSKYHDDSMPEHFRGEGDGAYGPHGQAPFPDFKKLMNVLKKYRR